MRYILLSTALYLMSFSSVALAQTETKTLVVNDFCGNLKKILESGKEQFKVVRGEATEKKTAGTPKKYFLSNIALSPSYKFYIQDEDKYPIAEGIMAESRFYSEQLEKDYQEIAAKIKECLKGEEWVIAEKDKNNDIYLADSDFKKLVVRENKTGKKVKFELFMNNNRILGYWVVEFKMEGIGL